MVWVGNLSKIINRNTSVTRNLNGRRTLGRIKRALTLVRFGSLKLVPVSRVFGYDRGPQSVARYYIDTFLHRYSADVCGAVLEVGDIHYTRQLGGSSVVHSDVLHAMAGNPKATIVDDLTKGESLLSDRYDCVLLPQTLQFIYDFRAAVSTAERILRPGGSLLVTLSGISQISRYDMERWGEFWRFTELSAKKIFEEFFPYSNITVESFGNVFAAVSLLQGRASRELKQRDLDFRDPDYPVIVGVRAIKPLPRSDNS